MNKILKIADKKIDSGLQRILDDFDESYEAMLRLHAAKGLLKSGNTIKKTMTQITESADALRDIIINVSEWVVKESIYVPLSIKEELNELCECYFGSLHEETMGFLQDATEKAGNPKLFKQMAREVEDGISRAHNEAELEIEAIVATNRSRGIKGIAKYIFSLVSKLWGG